MVNLIAVGVAGLVAASARAQGLPPLGLVAGLLLVLGAIGSVMYALAPRNKPIFDAARRPPAPRPGPEGGA